MRMRRALSEYRILGLKTNIPFHLQLMDSTRFIAGAFDTHGLDPPKSNDRMGIGNRQDFRLVTQEKGAAFLNPLNRLLGAEKNPKTSV